MNSKEEYDKILSILIDFLGNHDYTTEISLGAIFELTDKIHMILKEMKKQKV